MIARNRILYLDISSLNNAKKKALRDFLTVEHKKIVPNNEIYYRLNNTGTKAKIKVAFTPAMIQAYKTHAMLQSILISFYSMDNISTVLANDKLPEWDYA